MVPSRKILGDSLGRYQLLVQIGQGGMAEVFLGRLRGAAGFAKLVVLKRMHSHLSHDKRFIELFINEGRLVAKLSHSNICQVHELGEEEGSLFLVMEYLNGVPWEEIARGLPRGTEMELPLIAGVLGQACDGLHYAHQLRDHLGSPTPVVHRDVSPQNLFITTDGTCKVLDFGVAKMSTADRYSHTGVVLGKLPYMAPEQICGQPVDARTDVFAMGVVLWEALTGQRLFLRNSDYLIWKAINEDPIPSVLEMRPELPPEVDAIVRRALQRAPADRYPTIQAFAQELRQVAQPAPYDNHAIAEALRQLCALQLAEAHLRVATALAEIDKPSAERERERAAAEEAGRAETLLPTGAASVRLRDESFAQLRGPMPGAAHSALRRRRPWWPWLVVPGAAALLAVIIAVATHEELPAVGAPIAAAKSAPSEAGEASEASEAGETGAASGASETGAQADAGELAPSAEPAVRAPDTSGTPSTSSTSSTPSISSTSGSPAIPATANAPAPSDAPGAPEQRPRKRGAARGNRPTAPERPARPEAAPSGGDDELAAAVAKPGFYSVDSRPYATISIDGVTLGETPLFRVPLAPGTHRVRARRQDGTTKAFSITIVAGKEVSSGRLKW